MDLTNWNFELTTEEKNEVAKPLFEQLEKLEKVLCNKQEFCNGCPMLDYRRLKKKERYCLLKMFSMIVADMFDEGIK